MKNFVFAFALLCSSSLVAQFRYHVLSNGQTRSGIESHDNNASGNWSFAVGQASEASGDSSTAMGFSTAASGDFSTAMGYASSASGTASTAIGKQSFATADYSTAIGYQASAIEDYSTAIGFLAIAKGEFSTAMGMYTKAEDYASTAIGHYNYDSTPNPSEFSLQNTAFVIGNGTDNDNRSNAFEVLFDGSTTIAGNVTAPAFIGDGSQLTNIPTPTVNYGDITNTPLSYNDNDSGIQSSSNTASGDYSTALGFVTTASGDGSTALGVETNANGDYSTALGVTTKASGNASTAMGWSTEASGNYSTAMGFETTASGVYSMAMGFETTASGIVSIAMGNNNVASGTGSTAMGGGTTASGNYSMAMGLQTTASGTGSTAMGEGTTASGSDSTAMGLQTEASGFVSTAIGNNTTASGLVSTAMGYRTIAEDRYSFAIGIYNETKETPNPETFSYQNTAFVIGNGGFDSEGNWLGTDGPRSNAFEVLFDGTTTIAGDLNINSDARLKANIISLGATLSKLLQIDGKTYTMKKDANHKKKIGLLAQDIEKVFPELVSETNDIKSVNYQGLVPVLINAMKEQDEVIRSQDSRLNSQETKLNKQQQEIDELKAMVKALAKG